MTKVLITETAFNLGGSITSVELVVRQGLEKGVAFDALSAIDISPALPTGLSYGRIKVLNKWPVPSRVYYGHFAAQAFGILKRLLTGHHDVVLLNNGLFSNAAGLFAAHLTRRPAIQMQRGFEHDSRIWKIFHKWPTSYVAVSECIRDHLVERGVPPEQIVLAPEGIGPREPATNEQRLALRRKLGMPDDARVMGFVGRLDGWKGYDLFVDAAIKAMSKDPCLHAVMVGGASVNEVDKVAELEEKIKKEALADRLHMVGEVEAQEVEFYLRGMDVMLHTSITPEPFGRVLLEAMAVGVPVISSSEGGPREIVVDGVSGLLTPSGDVDGLAEAIASLYSTPERLPELSKAARQRVLDVYSEEVCAAPVLELIDNFSK